MLDEQWKFYLKKCEQLGIMNAMSKKQFEIAVIHGDKPYLEKLRDSGYKYGDLS